MSTHMLCHVKKCRREPAFFYMEHWVPVDRTLGSCGIKSARIIYQSPSAARLENTHPQ